MNETISKAIAKKNRPHKFRKWWNKNGYKVLRVVLFPVWIFCLCYEKINKLLDNRNKWDTARADEILTYYVPFKAEWDEESKELYFFDNGMGWGKHALRYLRKKDRRFWECNRYNMREYLIHDFKLEGFDKTVGDCSNGWTELIFTWNEKGA